MMNSSAIAAQLYTVREHCQNATDMAQTLSKLSRIGFKAIQVSGIGSEIKPTEVAKMALDCDLKIIATHMGLNRFLQDTDTVIEEHLLWNCKHPALGTIPQEYHTEDGLKKFLDEIMEIKEEMLSAGLDISYHNHSFELIRIGKKTWLQRLYEDADHEFLKAELDIYWIQHGGADPVDWILKCAGREPLVHLKDMIVTSESEQRYAELGEGNMNMAKIVDACQRGGVEWYIIEQDDCYGKDPFECLEKSYKSLLKM